VKERIQQIESKYKEASDWRQRTGCGVTSESSLHEALTKYCKYYFELQPVMEDRLHVRPPYTNQMDDEIDNQSDDDSLLGRNVHRLDEDGARMRDDEDGTRKRDDDNDDEITRIHVDRENSSVTSDVNVIRRVSPVATSAPNKKRKATPSFVQLNSAVKCIRRSTHIPSKTLLGASDGIKEYYRSKAEAKLETSRSKLENKYDQIEKLYLEEEQDEMESIRLKGAIYNESKEEIEDKIFQLKLENIEKKKKRRMAYLAMLQERI